MFLGGGILKLDFYTSTLRILIIIIITISIYMLIN